MKRIAVSAIALTFLLTSKALASNVCFLFGTSTVAASGLILPTKGTCTSFNGFFPNQPGTLLAGDVCRSSNGSTFLFNLFTRFNSLPDSLVGSWLASSGSGSGTECTSARCLTFAVTVIKCPNNVTIPHNAPGAEAESSAAFLSEEQ